MLTVLADWGLVPEKKNVLLVPLTNSLNSLAEPLIDEGKYQEEKEKRRNNTNS